MNWSLLFINYRFGDRDLEITIANFPVRRISYSDMESARKGWTLWNEHWSRRLDVWRSAVTIRRRTGLVRNLVITPDEPEAFLAKLHQHLSSQGNPKAGT